MQKMEDLLQTTGGLGFELSPTFFTIAIGFAVYGQEKCYYTRACSDNKEQ